MVGYSVSAYQTWLKLQIYLLWLNVLLIILEYGQQDTHTRMYKPLFHLTRVL